MLRAATYTHDTSASRMQEPGRRRATPPFAGVDLRRPKAYPASAPAEAEAVAEAGDPCPRCESRDTKFCYYNNYNTSQPRHYCKSCRRYWTKGGSLRNVPVSGASRKSSSASSSPSPTPSAPKRAKTYKHRRVAPAPGPEPEPSAEASTADAASTEAAATKSTADGPAAPRAADGGFTDTVAPAEDAATTDAATSKSTADDPASAAAALAADGGSTDPPVALGLADLTDAGAKEPASDASPFEWPSGCDLGSYLGNGVFADADPALFLNLP